MGSNILSATTPCKPPPPLDFFESVVQDTECYESRHGKGDVSPLDNELFGFLVLYT